MALYGFKGLLGVEVQPGRRFGTELADYARFWGGVGGLFHSDELPAYGITSDEVRRVYEALGADESRDAIVIVADTGDKPRKALEAVVERAVQALYGIPPETRAAQEDGTTRFMRPQPGAARMYPETDIPPLEVTNDIISEAEKIKPPSPAEKLKELQERYKLSPDLANQLLRDQHLAFFEELASRYADKVPASFIASIFTNILRSLAREGIPVDNVDEAKIEEVIRAVAEGRIAKDAVPEVIKYLAENPGSSVNEAIDKLGLGAVDQSLVEKMVEEAVEALRPEIEQRGLKALSKVMGRVMPKLRGRVDGKLVAEIARRKIKELLESRNRDS